MILARAVLDRGSRRRRQRRLGSERLINAGCALSIAIALFKVKSQLLWSMRESLARVRFVAPCGRFLLGELSSPECSCSSCSEIRSLPAARVAGGEMKVSFAGSPPRSAISAISYYASHRERITNHLERRSGSSAEISAAHQSSHRCMRFWRLGYSLHR